jgi:isoleucyl-tRNA synthetase
VFLAGFGKAQRRDDTLAAKWEKLLGVRTAVLKALEDARQAGTIGHSLDARVRLSAGEPLTGVLQEQEGSLPALFITSQVELVERIDGAVESPLMAGLRVAIEPARGSKCERCWNYSEAVGKDAGHPGLCARCLEVVTTEPT